jgi:glycosyltransferase involved in cell wall biosynthesis
MDIKVSIVTPSYNQGHFLEQTILSVLNQTYQNIEYIIMDGGSKDNSVEIIRRYESKIAYWQSMPDKGFSDAISSGFERSHGEILAYLNSDDLLAPDAVEKAVEYFETHPNVAMVYGNRVCIDEAGSLLYYKPNVPFFEKTLFIAMTIGQESCFWRRDVYNSCGGMDTSLNFAIDYDLFSKISQCAQIDHVGNIWGFFRKHQNSKTCSQYQSLGKKECLLIQNNIWHKRPNRFIWLFVLSFTRIYAIIVMPFIRKPKWPNPQSAQSSSHPFHRLSQLIKLSLLQK